MQTTEIIEGACTGERVGIRVVSVEQLGPKRRLLLDYRVRNVVVIDPLDGGPHGNRESLGENVKLSIMITFVASCAATAPNASNAPMTGPKSNATTRARSRTSRAAAKRSWLIGICMHYPRSTGQRLIDDRERLVTLRDSDGGQPQQGAKFV